MKLHCLAFLVGSIASAATVSFRYNSINALALSPAYRSWRLFPEGEEVFPGKRITRPIYDDSFRLEATRLNGHVDFYEPQSDETFDEGNQLTLSGEFNARNDHRIGSGNWR